MTLTLKIAQGQRPRAILKVNNDALRMNHIAFKFHNFSVHSMVAHGQKTHQILQRHIFLLPKLIGVWGGGHILM